MNYPPDLKTAGNADIQIELLHFKNERDTFEFKARPKNCFALLSNGSIEVKSHNQTQFFTAPHVFLIKKENTHQVIASESGTVISVFEALESERGSDA